MAEKTVTIGDTEVTIRETDDGFEAVGKEDDIFVSYLEDEHCSGGRGSWDGAVESDARASKTRWSDGDAAVYDDTKGSYDGQHGASRSQMKALDNDENVTILGTGVHEGEDRFEVHLRDSHSESR
jgi:hypothetical protein